MVADHPTPMMLLLGFIFANLIPLLLASFCLVLFEVMTKMAETEKIEPNKALTTKLPNMLK